MTRRHRLVRRVAILGAVSLAVAACGDDDDDAETVTPEITTEDTTEGTTAGTTAGTTDGTAGTTDGAAALAVDTATCTAPQGMDVSLQLQWVTQAQFGGYYAAVDQGFYEDAGLNVAIQEGGVDIVPQTELANGNVDFAIAWVPKALQSREQGAEITDIAQIFQRSGTLQVSWAEDGITSPEDLEGKNVGNWGFGNEFELFAGLTRAGLDPATDVTLVQQSFDMQALLNREIDAAQAMTYNEYAQVLEAVDPETGELYQPDDFNVINWNDEGTAMLQDAIWADTDRLSDPEYCGAAIAFVKASMQGWAYCRDNPQACADLVVSEGSQLGASHQLWQMNEINKLIWPSPEGIGVINQDDWERTVDISLETRNADGDTVISSAPSPGAYTNDIVQAALDELRAEDVDVNGDDFEPIEVTLNEGGA